MKQTPTYRLLAMQLGRPPIDDIRAGRELPDGKDRPDPIAFHRIARKLSEESGVEVSIEAVRRWYLWDSAERARGNIQFVPA